MVADKGVRQRHVVLSWLDKPKLNNPVDNIVLSHDFSTARTIGRSRLFNKEQGFIQLELSLRVGREHNETNQDNSAADGAPRAMSQR